MIQAEADETSGLILLNSDWPLRDRERAKRIPGVRFPRSGPWTAPLTWASCIALRTEYGEELAISESLNQWATRELSERIQPALTLRKALEPLEDWHAVDRELPLYPFQQTGVRFLQTVRTAYLGDEMGTGKTRQSLEALRELAAAGEEVFPAIIVAPSAVKYNWLAEIQKWWDTDTPTVRVIDGTVAKRRKQFQEDADITIINFDLVRSHSRLAPYGSIALKKCIVCDPTLPDDKNNAQTKCERCPKELNETTWVSIIVDEAHRLKDPATKQTRGVWALRTPDTKNVFCLSGTAIEDNPVDLWGGLHMLDPVSFPNKSKFIDRYCKLDYNYWGGMKVVGVTDDEKLRAEFYQLVDPLLRRMTKEAVLTFLPPKVYMTRNLPMSPAQAKAYKQMNDHLIAEVPGGHLVTLEQLTQITRLHQLASSMVRINDDDSVELCKPSNKVDGLIELVSDLPPGEPLVVFAVAPKLLQMAAEILQADHIETALVIGGQSARERQQNIDKFNTGRAQVIFCSAGAGSVGINLVRAKYLVYMQRDWSLVNDKQSTDRVHRIGSEQHDKITIIDLVSEGTVESKVLEALAAKDGRAQEVYRDIDLITN